MILTDSLSEFVHRSNAYFALAPLTLERPDVPKGSETVEKTIRKDRRGKERGDRERLFPFESVLEAAPLVCRADAMAKRDA